MYFLPRKSCKNINQFTYIGPYKTHRPDLFGSNYIKCILNSCPLVEKVLGVSVTNAPQSKISFIGWDKFKRNSLSCVLRWTNSTVSENDLNPVPRSVVRCGTNAKSGRSIYSCRFLSIFVCPGAWCSRLVYLSWSVSDDQDLRWKVQDRRLTYDDLPTGNLSVYQSLTY